jgi:hypothetical protein
MEILSATLTIDAKKHARLANRIVLKAIESEEEHDHMVAAVEHLMDKGEDHLSPEESALLETMAILVQAYDDRHNPVPQAAPNVPSARSTQRSSPRFSRSRSISLSESPAGRGLDRHPGTTPTDLTGIVGKQIRSYIDE